MRAVDFLQDTDLNQPAARLLGNTRAIFANIWINFNSSMDKWLFTS